MPTTAHRRDFANNIFQISVWHTNISWVELIFYTNSMFDPPILVGLSWFFYQLTPTHPNSPQFSPPSNVFNGSTHRQLPLANSDDILQRSPLRGQLRWQIPSSGNHLQWRQPSHKNLWRHTPTSTFVWPTPSSANHLRRQY